MQKSSKKDTKSGIFEFGTVLRRMYFLFCYKMMWFGTIRTSDEISETDSKFKWKTRCCSWNENTWHISAKLVTSSNAQGPFHFWYMRVFLDKNQTKKQRIKKTNKQTKCRNVFCIHSTMFIYRNGHLMALMREERTTQTNVLQWRRSACILSSPWDKEFTCTFPFH